MTFGFYFLNLILLALIVFQLEDKSLIKSCAGLFKVFIVFAVNITYLDLIFVLIIIGFNHTYIIEQCFSTFLMSWTTFRRDFLLGPTS